MPASTVMREGTSMKLPEAPGFEGRWAQGKFDTGKLDKAIQNLEHLADADQLRAREPRYARPRHAGICASFAPRAADIRTTATGITVTIRTGATIRIGASLVHHPASK